jgi:hypothetical protein
MLLVVLFFIFQKFYPINYLRNIAVKEARTPYLLFVDVDLVVNYGIYTMLKQYIKQYILHGTNVVRAIVCSLWLNALLFPSCIGRITIITALLYEKPPIKTDEYSSNDSKKMSHTTSKFNFCICELCSYYIGVDLYLLYETGNRELCLL